MSEMERMDQDQVSNASEYAERLPIEVKIVTHNPERGTLATAEVKVADFFTIRNVKIREDDYGLNVVMPRTKMPYSEQFKDSVFFASKELKDQFDMAVKKAYMQEMGLEQEDEMEEEIEEELVESMAEETMDGMTMVSEM